MSPYQIRILLHYYTTPIDYQDNAMIRAETLRGFVADGLLTRTWDKLEVMSRDTPEYAATDRLRCFVDAICALPLPEWRMP